MGLKEAAKIMPNEAWSILFGKLPTYLYKGNNRCVASSYPYPQLGTIVLCVMLFVYRGSSLSPHTIRKMERIVYFCVFIAITNVCLCEAVTAPKWQLRDGREIPSLALGTWLGNNTQGRIIPNGEEVQRAVEMAVDLGYRHIDTAYAYKVEDQVGRALRKKMDEGIKREELFITTKLWNDRHAREAVVPALRESLEALNLSYVDLYLIHWPLGQFANRTFDYTDYLETWRGMVEAKQLGLAKSIGVSNFNQHQIDRILEAGLETPAVLQVEINLNLQQPDLLSYCKDKGIVVMGYTPFGSMLYSKARADAPPPRVDDPQLVDIAQKHNKTTTQVALRYLLDLGVIPIPKALTLNHLSSNIDVFDFDLTQDERAALKTFDHGYRTIPQHKWMGHPFYPFEKSAGDSV